MKRSLHCCLAHSRPRRGSFLIESVVAIALLATAFIALSKLAASSAAISRDADQRLAATLAAENVLERLQIVSFDDVIQRAASIGEQIQESSGYDVLVQTSEFRAGERDSIHLAVTVRPNAIASITLHDWRISETASPEQGDDDE